MIGGEHAVRVACPPDELWTFMEHFPNWAHYVVGYRDLRQVDDTTAVWTLRGDVGILSREVEIEVSVTSWKPGHSADFALEGVTERLSGTGGFVVSAATPDEVSVEDAAVPADRTEPAASRSAVPVEGWWSRLRRRFGRWMIRRAQGGAVPTSTPSVAGSTTGSTAVGGASGSVLEFRLEVTPGGPMAPMLEMLMAPLLEPAAEDLSLRIREAIEGSAA